MHGFRTGKCKLMHRCTGENGMVITITLTRVILFLSVTPLKIFPYQPPKNLCLLTMLKLNKNTGFILIFACISAVHAQTLKQLGIVSKSGGVKSFCEYKNEWYCAGGAEATYPGYGFLRKWDGLNWVEISDCPDSAVMSMVIFQNKLYLGGWFDYLASWDGQNWEKHVKIYGSFPAPDYWRIEKLVVYNNELIAGGQFQAVRKTSDDTWNYETNSLFRWDGIFLQTFGRYSLSTDADYDPVVYTFSIFSNDLLIAGGFNSLRDLDSTKYIDTKSFAKWDGSVLSPMSFFSLGSKHGNKLHASYNFNDSMLYVMNNDSYNFSISQWDGVNFNVLLADSFPYRSVYAIIAYKNIIYFGGDFEFIKSPGDTIRCLMKYDGNNFSRIMPQPLKFLNSGYDVIRAFHVRNDTLLIGGSFTLINNEGDTVRNIAYFTDSPVGVSSQEKSNMLKKDFFIYKNPESEQLIIHSQNNPINEPVTIKIMDALGRSLYEKENIYLPAQVNSRDIPEGVMFIKITSFRDKTVLATQKFVNVR